MVPSISASMPEKGMLYAYDDALLLYSRFRVCSSGHASAGVRRSLTTTMYLTPRVHEHPGLTKRRGFRFPKKKEKHAF